jgi:serine/threonine-protein kinase
LALLKKTTAIVKPNKEPLWRFVAVALPTIVAASIITLLAHSFGFLESFENTGLSTLIDLNPLAPEHIFVVDIDNDDYKNLFASTSPLNPDKVVELIKAIEEGEPKLIVIDLDTADDRFRSVKLPGIKNVIWSCGVAPAPEQDSADGKSANGDGQTLVLDRLLGSEVSNRSEHWGVAILPRDSDGIIRHYCRSILAKRSPSAKAESESTLIWSAVCAFRGDESKADNSDYGRFILNSSGGSKYIPHISASNMLATCKGSGWKEAVKGKIVFLGGFFDAARDSYPSASGEMPGTDLQAEGVESELMRGGVRPVGDVLLACALMLSGLLATLLNFRLGGRFLVVTGVAAVLLSTLALASFSFWSLYLWMNFVPVTIAVQSQYFMRARAEEKREESAKREIAEQEATQREQAVKQREEALISGETTASLSASYRSMAEPRFKNVCLTCGREFSDLTLTTCPDDESNLSRIIDRDIVGTTFAHKYEILEEVGQGGMSTVYRAKHNLMQNIVAIKVLRPHLESEKENVMRFQREAQATSMVSHPNVVGVHDFGLTEEGRAFIVMDYIQGQSLKDLIGENGTLDENRAVELFSQICEGLACAHDNGILHRDLKPSNIMLIEENHRKLVKIVDFGIAKIATSDLSLTSTGELVGSPLYMSPEQCRGQKLDRRSDIYSFGCIMYECLSGHPPFNDTSVMGLMEKQMEELPPSLDKNKVPNWLAMVTYTALEKDPDDRFSDTRQIKDCLAARTFTRPPARTVPVKVNQSPEAQQALSEAQQALTDAITQAKQPKEAKPVTRENERSGPEAREIPVTEDLKED